MLSVGLPQFMRFVGPVTSTKPLASQIFYRATRVSFSPHDSANWPWRKCEREREHEEARSRNEGSISETMNVIADVVSWVIIPYQYTKPALTQEVNDNLFRAEHLALV